MGVEYVRYFNLPKPPDKLLQIYKEETNLWPDALDDNSILHNDAFYRTSEQCEMIDEWCKRNVSEHMVFGVHRIVRDLPPHRDNTFKKDGMVMHCESKLIYLMDVGGSNVITSFWTDDKKTKLKEYVIQPFRWHMLQCNKVHGVEGITGIRWGISAHNFHQIEKYSDN